MPTFNRVREAYSPKKKNALSPYLTSGMTQSAGASQPRMAKTMPLDVSGSASASQPSGGQSAVSRAYSRATTPASPASPQQYEPGSILRESAASANTSNTANAGSAITSTPNTPLYSAYNAQATPSVSTPAGAQNSAVYRAYSAQSTPQTVSEETPAQSAVYSAYGTQNGQQNGAYSAQRQNAINQATANYNKLLNYLPEYLDVMGMRGLGVSEQALLNAASDYQQGIADINASYDELERAYIEQQRANREQQIANINTLSGELSAYIADAGENFSTDGYDRFKQGLLQAGYTEQEIAAAENLLGQNDLDRITEKAELEQIDSNIIGEGIALSSAQEKDFGSYRDTGKKNSGQYKLVQDILTVARGGAIPNGTIIDFNYGVHDEEKFFVYYDGYFYPIDASSVNPMTDKIIGRGRGNSFAGYIDPLDVFNEYFVKTIVGT